MIRSAASDRHNADADTVAARVWSALRDHLFAILHQGQFRMSARKTEQGMAVRHPRNGRSVRPSRNRGSVLNAYHSNRIPHAR
jgi:hypothetical protein